MALQRRELLVLAGLLGAGGAVSLLVQATRPLGRNAAASPVTGAVFAEPAPVTGNLHGSLQLAVFSDYNCGVCRSGWPALAEAIEADGDVQARHLEWPIFGDDSRDAARVALASEQQGIYPAVHQSLMEGARATLQTARQAVVAAGGNLADLEKFLAANGPEIDGRLARFAFHAFSLGLRGTPSFLTRTTLVEGALSVRQWQRLFRQSRG